MAATHRVHCGKPIKMLPGMHHSSKIFSLQGRPQLTNQPKLLKALRPCLYSIGGPRTGASPSYKTAPLRGMPPHPEQGVIYFPGETFTLPVAQPLC